jgi:Zn-dependent protease
MGWPPTWTRLLLLPALVVGFTVHELAHAIVAYLLGDTDQIARKRLSFNPLRHISVPGMIAFMVLGIGWAKPVSVHPARFRMRNQPFGMFLVSISGALANLGTGVVCIFGMIMTGLVVGLGAGVPWADAVRYMVSDKVGFDLHGLVVALSYYMFSVNLLLALFNLIPLPPLDGFSALMSLISAIRLSAKRKSGGGRAVTTAPAIAQTGEATRSPAQIHFDIGLAYHREGKLDEAIARYRQAIAQGEGFALAHYNMGLAYWAKGRPAFAEQALKAATHTADLAVRAEAEKRLQELGATQTAASEEGVAPPPPLEASPVSQVLAPSAIALDPAVKRRLWLRLVLGGTGLILLAIGAWLFVTLATLSALRSG